MVALNAGHFYPLSDAGLLHLADGSISKVRFQLLVSMVSLKGGGFITGAKNFIQRAVDADVAVLETSPKHYLGLVLGVADGSKVAVVILGPVAASRMPKKEVR